MKSYDVLVAREFSEYAEITIEAKNKRAAKKEAMRILTEENDLLDHKWKPGGETQGERVCDIREVK